MHVLGNFLSASYLAVHPQQQAQFVALSAAGVRQANRQRASSVGDGPISLDLLKHPEADDDGGFSLPGPFTTQPTSAAFNPFFPGLLLVAYAEGDLALFDCALCVPITHWASAVLKAASGSVSIAWSTRRPCVFFVKCADSLDVWDLADKTHLPVQTIDLSGEPYKGEPAPSCAELFVSSDGRPVVGQGGAALVLGLPASLTTPLQEVPRHVFSDEKPLEELLLPGHETGQVFPTLSKNLRAVEVPPHCQVERDVMRRLVAGIAPMQAWV